MIDIMFDRLCYVSFFSILDRHITIITARDNLFTTAIIKYLKRKILAAVTTHNLRAAGNLTLKVHLKTVMLPETSTLFLSLWYLRND